MFVLLAPEASAAVVIRRGPSQWWRVTLWDTRTDRFEGGQRWPYGRWATREEDTGFSLTIAPSWSQPPGPVLGPGISAARGSALLAKWLARSHRARSQEEILRLAKVVWRFDSRTRGAHTRRGHDVLRGVPSPSFEAPLSLHAISARRRAGRIVRSALGRLGSAGSSGCDSGWPCFGGDVRERSQAPVAPTGCDE
jgi:hypothetical protein